MAQDWNSVWKDAVNAAVGATTIGSEGVRMRFAQIAEGHKSALESISRARLKNLIDQPTYESELRSEAAVFRAELLELQVLTKAIAQRAANAFLKVISNAVSTGIKGLI
jgi:hypothetical protein